MADNQQDALSEAFASIIREWLSPAELADVDRLNAKEKSTSICHTHDFCDANMAMHEAFVKAVGREPDCGSDEDAGLMNRAWDAAIKRGFAHKD